MKRRTVFRIFLVCLLIFFIYRDRLIWRSIFSLDGLESDTNSTAPIESILGASQVDCKDERPVLSWVDLLTEDQKAQATTVKSKIKIAMNIEATAPLRFRQGGVMSLVFDCVRDSRGVCDFHSPYLAFVGECSAKKSIRFTHWKWDDASDSVKVFRDSSSRLGDGRLSIDVMNGREVVAALELLAVDPSDNKKVARVKRGESFALSDFFKLDRPYHAYVGGVEMSIVAIRINK